MSTPLAELAKAIGLQVQAGYLVPLHARMRIATLVGIQDEDAPELYVDHDLVRSDLRHGVVAFKGRIIVVARARYVLATLDGAVDPPDETGSTVVAETWARTCLESLSIEPGVETVSYNSDSGWWDEYLETLPMDGRLTLKFAGREDGIPLPLTSTETRRRQLVKMLPELLEDLTA
jgi:hypothetical protein